MSEALDQTLFIILFIALPIVAAAEFILIIRIVRAYNSLQEKHKVSIGIAHDKIKNLEEKLIQASLTVAEDKVKEIYKHEDLDKQVLNLRWWTSEIEQNMEVLKSYIDDMLTSIKGHEKCEITERIERDIF
jgi:hypothetical protein